MKPATTTHMSFTAPHDSPAQESHLYRLHFPEIHYLKSHTFADSLYRRFITQRVTHFPTSFSGDSLLKESHVRRLPSPKIHYSRRLIGESRLCQLHFLKGHVSPASFLNDSFVYSIHHSDIHAVDQQSLTVISIIQDFIINTLAYL